MIKLLNYCDISEVGNETLDVSFHYEQEVDNFFLQIKYNITMKMKKIEQEETFEVLHSTINHLKESLTKTESELKIVTEKANKIDTLETNFNILKSKFEIAIDELKEENTKLKNEVK